MRTFPQRGRLRLKQTKNMANNATEITASWEPEAADRKHLRMHLILRRLRLFFTPPQVSSVGMAYLLSIIASHIPLLKMIPAWEWMVGWPVLVILAYVISSLRVMQRSIASQSWPQSITIIEDRLIVEYPGTEPEYYRLAQLTVQRHPEGIYIDQDSISRLIPSRAFKNGEDAENFEYIFHRSRGTANDVRIPPTHIDGFPIAISYQPNKWDAVYAYYHGYARSYLRSGIGMQVLMILAGTVILCMMGGLVTGYSITEILSVSLIISIMLGAIAALYVITPAFPLSVAEQRYSKARLFTVALGKEGIAIHNGRELHIQAWETIRKLASDRRCVYLDLRNDLILIPNASFLDANQAKEFLSAAQAYQRGETPFSGNSTAVWPPAPEARI